jgi:large subunit ribosomal protein L33
MGATPRSAVKLLFDIAANISILFPLMRDKVTLECTEAKAEGKPASRYISTRNKKLQTERMEIKKYNPHLRRHTVHKEIK